MSFPYSTVFTQLGRCAYWMNAWVNYQNTLCLAATTGEADDLQSVYTSYRNLGPGFQQSVQSQASTMAGWVSTVQQVANTTLSSLQLSLNAPSNDPSTILSLLATQMTADSQTIEHTVIGSPTVTAGTNNGNGVLKVSTINSLGITDERIIPEVVEVICNASQWSGGTAGAETFRMTGYPSIPANTYGTLGNGTGPTLRVADAGNIISNGNFETWTVANTPNNWTTVGTIGTNILQNTANPHSGTSCLELAGDGTTATISLTQVIASQVSSTTLYAASVWLRKSGTVTSGSTLAITIQGSGATTQTLLSLDPSTLTTSYAQYVIFFATSATVPPSNYSASISWTSANSAGASAIILIDDFVLIQPTVFGYAAYALFRGSSDFAVGDSFAVTTSVSSTGVFQGWFSRFFGKVLPSSASPTISDALASALP